MEMYKRNTGNYLAKIFATAVITAVPKIALANNPKTQPVKKQGIEYVLNELGNEVNEFGEAVGVIIDEGWNYGTLDKRWAQKDRKLNDWLEDAAIWPVKVGCDVVKTGGALVHDAYNLPGEAMRRAQEIKAKGYAGNKPQTKKGGILEGIGNLLGGAVELVGDTGRYLGQVVAVTVEGAGRYAKNTLKHIIENPIDSVAETATIGFTVDRIVDATHGGGVGAGEKYTGPGAAYPKPKP